MRERMRKAIEGTLATLSPPGDTIQETIDAIGMSQTELAERMGRPKEKVNDMIKGREPITTPTAFQLERVLGIPASFWINREKEYRKQVYELEQEEFLENCKEWLYEFPVKELKKLGWLPDTNQMHVLVNSLLTFFSVASADEWDSIYIKNEVSASFRISLANTSNPYSISTWLRIGELEAKKLKVEEYDRKKFKDNLSDIKELAFESPKDFSRRLQDICALCGVAVIYTPNLPKAPISGAARWVYNTPLIQLSGRYKTNDHFWFTFFHEAGHIIEHGKKDIFLESVEGTPVDRQKEAEADRFASTWLLTDAELEEIIANRPISETKIIEFSKRFRTLPGIIIGRLQHMKLIPHSVGNRLRTAIDLFDN
jgi:HTH-type transcriptional regulator/antitoxin HigA